MGSMSPVDWQSDGGRSFLAYCAVPRLTLLAMTMIRLYTNIDPDLVLAMPLQQFLRSLCTCLIYFYPPPGLVPEGSVLMPMMSSLNV